ncbi:MULTISPECIES: hypothetical protein [Streptomyces]|uniref:Uncharacterized protein n=1 Tax=Streptomyces doudnae TaxID=3075536 RepID=A0ABD5EZI8_9ACTN|nr:MULTISPECIES: hypothetical protein [unclassified Streptomyces]MDT0439280.1 hypothetical protein [Streptomyces sp. DSM 41981]MYQ63451.1 hypothetical protein [Streptomyces sp. SID4950]
MNRAADAAAAKAVERATDVAEKNPADLDTAEFDELNRLFAQNHDAYPFAERIVGALGARGTLRLWDDMSDLDASDGYGDVSDVARADDLADARCDLPAGLPR